MAIAPPIVIDLGNVQDADVKELLDGTGRRLLEEVEQVMQTVRQRTAGADTGFLVPIVAVYSKPGHLDTGEQLTGDFNVRRQRDRAGRKIARVLRS
jgi:hypothetical protein